MESENKNTALALIKNYYEDFYLKNAATNAEKVKNIQYFLDWLNNTATVDDIVVNEVDLFIRQCDLNVKVEYWYSGGSGTKYDQTITITALVASDQIFTSYFDDVYYSTEAGTKIIPGNIYDIAKKESEKALYAGIRNSVFSGCRVLDYKVSEPTANKYLSCTLNYPHPVADKDGGHTRSFHFIIWKDHVYMSQYAGPDGANLKPIAERKSGCYVATAVYGSYDCPQVWTLRRYRDDTLSSTWYGRTFIHLYYAISPTLVKWFGKTKWFKKLWKGKLDRMVKTLNEQGVEDTPYNDKNWN